MISVFSLHFLSAVAFGLVLNHFLHCVLHFFEVLIFQDKPTRRQRKVDWKLLAVATDIGMEYVSEFVAFVKSRIRASDLSCLKHLVPEMGSLRAHRRESESEVK